MIGDLTFLARPREERRYRRDSRGRCWRASLRGKREHKKMQKRLRLCFTGYRFDKELCWYAFPIDNKTEWLSSEFREREKIVDPKTPTTTSCVLLCPQGF
jgi:hypothetical protein